MGKLLDVIFRGKDDGLIEKQRRSGGLNTIELPATIPYEKRRSIGELVREEMEKEDGGKD